MIEFGLLSLSDDGDGRGWLDSVPATAALVTLDLYGPARPGLRADDLAMRLALVGLATPLSGLPALGTVSQILDTSGEPQRPASMRSTIAGATPR
jgi:hypothetical protein